MAKERGLKVTLRVSEDDELRSFIKTQVASAVTSITREQLSALITAEIEISPKVEKAVQAAINKITGEIKDYVKGCITSTDVKSIAREHIVSHVKELIDDGVVKEEVKAVVKHTMLALLEDK